MVLGIICGITLNISFGSINIAEIIFILYSIAYLIKKKKIKIDKNFNTYIIFSLIFIMYTFCYYKLEIVSNENIMKNAIKYTEMLIITFLAYEQCIYDVDKFLKFFEVFLLTDFVFSYLGHTYKSFSYFIHYSFFILLMCILLVIYDKNKKVKTLLYIIAFILSVVGHSRSSLIILLITILYEMYQYILNFEDIMMEEYLKKYTFLNKEEIEAIMKEHNETPEKRIAQKRLAYEVITYLHGEDAYKQAVKISESLFSGDIASLTSKEIEQAFKGIEQQEIDKEYLLVDLLVEMGICKSKREAREFITNGSISINGKKITDLEFMVTKEVAIEDKYIIIRRGKKKYFIIVFK